MEKTVNFNDTLSTYNFSIPLFDAPMWIDLSEARDSTKESDLDWFKTEHVSSKTEVGKTVKLLNDLNHVKSSEDNKTFEDMVKAHNERIQGKSKTTDKLARTEKFIKLTGVLPKKSVYIKTEKAQWKPISKSFSTNDLKIPTEITKKSAISCQARTQTYTPRLFDAKTLKLWEAQTKLNWYELSPDGRDKANRQMAEIKKSGLIK